VIYAVRKQRNLPDAPTMLTGPDNALTIARAKNGTAILRRFTVLIDGAEVGRIGPGEVRHFPLQTGTHTIAVKIDWCTSPAVTVEKLESENLPLRCGIRFDDWRCIVVPFTRPREYVHVFNDG